MTARPNIVPSDTLLALAERCEAATGPDRELDCAIYNAAPDGENRKAERLPMEKWGGRFDDGWRTMWADREDKYPEQLKRYTSSFDAVITLIDHSDEWDVSTMYSIARATVGLNRDHETSWPGNGEHTGCNAVLALCAAALRARAAQ